VRSDDGEDEPTARGDETSIGAHFDGRPHDGCADRFAVDVVEAAFF
jgi:hypothetical protein